MKIISRLLILLGIIFLLIASAYLITNYNNTKIAKKNSESIIASLEKIKEQTILSNQEENYESKQQEYTIDNNTYIGTINIPKLNLNLPINESYDYDKLKLTPCLYYGKINTKNFIICAHNYITQFGYISNLESKDIITITDINNNTYYYQVVLTEILNDNDINSMLNSEFDMTLFTCDTTGTKRITVRCNQIII